MSASTIERAVTLVDSALDRLFSGLIASAATMDPAASAVLSPVGDDVRRYARERLSEALSRHVEVSVETSNVVVKRPRPRPRT